MRIYPMQQHISNIECIYSQYKNSISISLIGTVGFRRKSRGEVAGTWLPSFSSREPTNSTEADHRHLFLLLAAPIATNLTMSALAR
jgi:hypothetical protein